MAELRDPGWAGSHCQESLLGGMVGAGWNVIPLELWDVFSQLQEKPQRWQGLLWLQAVLGVEAGLELFHQSWRMQGGHRDVQGPGNS